MQEMHLSLNYLTWRPLLIVSGLTMVSYAIFEMNPSHHGWRIYEQ